jgi:hypothetical protein
LLALRIELVDGAQIRHGQNDHDFVRAENHNAKHNDQRKPDQQQINIPVQMFLRDYIHQKHKTAPKKTHVANAQKTLQCRVTVRRRPKPKRQNKQTQQQHYHTRNVLVLQKNKPHNQNDLREVQNRVRRRRNFRR